MTNADATQNAGVAALCTCQGTKTCHSYTGVACIDGSCPKAWQEEYEERGMDVPKSCIDCWYNLGCEDCALEGTQHCEKNTI